jgi:Na+/H+ antiporter NhaD/arsenite permease-like protein
MELISLAALVFVIALSCFTKVNPGLLSLGLAWLLGYYGARIGIPQIVEGFPTHMFLVLVGVTYLFSIAKQNGTLDRLALASLRLVKNDPVHAPVLFFVMAAVLSAAGASNIGAVALLAPIAMAVAWQTGIGAFFMTIILVCGANAGTFSPFALTGIIANGLIAKLGLNMDPWMQVFIPNLAAQTVLAAVVYILLSWRIKAGKKSLRILNVDTEPLNKPWDANQKFTLAAIIMLIAGSVILKTDIGFLSLTLAAALTLFAANQGKEALKLIPWDTILMVCGINTLIGIMESLGGLGLLSDLLAKVSTPQNVTAVTALTTGILSAFSSSSGVVLPSFIPLVPQLIEKIGGGSATAIVSSINVGSHLVDISPLSSLGALCIASALHEDKEKLFRNLLGFGLSMAAVGALLCFLLFGWMKT